MSEYRITITISEEQMGSSYREAVDEVYVDVDMREDSVYDFAAYLAAHARFTAPREPIWKKN